MTKAVLVKFKREGPWGPKGTEAVITPGVERGREIYGDAFDIVRYEDGTPYKEAKIPSDEKKSDEKKAD